MNFNLDFFEYLYFFPEISLLTLSLFFFSFYLIPQKRNAFYFNTLAIFVFSILISVCFYFIFFQLSSSELLYHNQLTADYLSFYFKIIATLATLIYFFLSSTQLRQKGLLSFEFYFFILLVLLSIFFLASAYDFLVLYVSIELQSLILYVLATRERYSYSSTEAGLKYFIVGGFASSLLLFGITLIYGYTGSTSFVEIAKFLLFTGDYNGVLIGFSFILVSLFFKLGLAPFHMWVPDVYEGSPTASTAFFATISKIGLIVILIRLVFTVFFDVLFILQPFLNFVAIFSIVLGSLGALFQTNLKRLFAYSGISHMGFILLGLSTGSVSGLNAALLYLLIYLVLSFSIFGVILVTINKNNYTLESLNDLVSLTKSDPVLSFIFLISLFSLAGIPPLAGFFSKFYVLLSAVQSGFYFLATVAILMSVISSFYYIRLIKMLYFEPSARVVFQLQLSTLSAVTLGYLVSLNILFFIFPTPFFSFASFVVNSFFYLSI